MKRILFVLALVMSAVTMMAEDVRVTTKDGLVIAGEFINGTDSTYTIKCTHDIRPYIIERYGTDTITFQLKNISEVAMYGKVLVPHNGKLTTIGSKTEIAKLPLKKPQPSDPNKVIGKALKTTGAVALGIGVPCLFTGTILMAVGLSEQKVELKENMSTKEMLDKVQTINAKMDIKSKLALAGCILFPIGASLTIVGIPLHIHGNKIITMNLNYTGNGIGVGVEF